MSSLRELIKLQEGLLMRLATVSSQQLELVQSGNMTELLRVLGYKQQLLDENDEIRNEIKLLGGIESNQHIWQNEAEKNRVNESLEHCRRLFEEIIRNDTQSMNETETQRADLLKEIKRFGQISQTQIGYHKTAIKITPNNTHRRFDVREK
jgi:hypothetical protein